MLRPINPVLNADNLWFILLLSANEQWMMSIEYTNLPEYT